MTASLKSKRLKGLIKPRRVVRGSRKKEKNQYFVTLGMLEIHALRSFWASIVVGSYLLIASS